MNTFKRWNNITGWVVFLIASAVYLLTIEPTTSLWDCSEFIPTSYKLEVGHPPGAPLFMLIARIFTIFAPDTANVAAMVNSMSALCSAATILFLFWSITHLARRILRKGTSEMSLTESIVAIGSGVVGALAYTFTDTFWFSAVEGEVYAMSSMFTAAVVWAMLKWEDVADEKGADRWLILIAYLMGLSIGVHILNLLTIPAIVFIYYFRKTKKITTWGVIKALLVAGAILLFINSIIIPYTTAIGAWFDKLFANTFGTPVNVGIIVFALLLLGGLGYLVWLTHKRGKRVWNIILLCLTVIVIGYSSYASMVIRAVADPPMNSNNPDNPYSLLYVLNRDQYGGKPILYGAQYSAPITGVDYSTKYYLDDNGKYAAMSGVDGYIFPSNFKVLFPRMYDGHSGSAQSHIEGYRNWGEVSDSKFLPYTNYRGETESIAVPTAGENMRFFFSYQLNFMFWRYFMWNFAGRQNDIQSNGEIYNGQWLSGINAVDELYLGPQSNLPSEMRDTPSRNTYYFLPFLLGLIGLFYQLNRDHKNFIVVMLLFLLMGVALVIYFNSTTGEPRERDYVFAGAFYAFSIWIGLGVMFINELLSKIGKPKVGKVAVGWWRLSLPHSILAVALCLSVPIILAAQNWDDHDRSHRYVARDIGYNYLSGLLPNAIIMNYGDNDTYPLWYNQEVEGVRLDVRIMNTSYLGSGWYTEEMTHRYNESAPVPFSLPKHKYLQQNDFVYVADLVGGDTITARQAMDYVALDNPQTRQKVSEHTTVDVIPAKHLAIPVNKEMCIATGLVKAEDAHLMEDTIYVNISGNTLDKPVLMILDMLSNFNWERPLYFTQPQIILPQLGLMDYLQFDGYAYRFVPIRTPYNSSDWGGFGRFDTELVYKNMMETFRYGNVADPRVHVDYFTQYNYTATRMWINFARLADALSAEGDTLRAVKVLDFCMETFPVSPRKFQWSYQHVNIINAYYKAGAMAKGDAVLNAFASVMMEYLDYYSQFPTKRYDQIKGDVDMKLMLLSELWRTADQFQRTEISEKLEYYFGGLEGV